MTGREKSKVLGKSCPKATLSTTKPTWSIHGVRPGFYSEKLASNHLEMWHHKFTTSIKTLRLRKVTMSSCMKLMDLKIMKQAS
jgi:hypothetical protein